MTDQMHSWLDTAVSGIRFKPDRLAVRKELAGHIEDKAAGLRRSFPDISQEEAQTLALSGMGDPEELKISLAKVHRPWLGYLWRASQWMVFLLLLALNLFNLSNSFSGSLRGRGGVAAHSRIQNGEQAQAGQYTFQIVGADYMQWPDDAGDNLHLTLRVSAPKFWEPISQDALCSYLSAAGPDGVWYPMAEPLPAVITAADASGGGTPVYRYQTGVSRSRWGPGWQEFNIWLPAAGWTMGDRVTLRLDSPAGGFTLSALVMEKVVAA